MNNRLKAYSMVDHDIPDKNFVSTVRGGHAYLFHFDDELRSRVALQKVFAAFANDPEHSFTHDEQVLLTQKAEAMFPSGDCPQAA